MRTIEQIDRDIDANRRALMSRLHVNPDMSAQAWQNAWDRCPDLQRREKTLYLERYDAQQARDLAAHREHQRMERAQRRALRAKRAA
jgi:hypothetical protein